MDIFLSGARTIPPQRGDCVMVFIAPTYAPVHIGGPTADPGLARFQRALHDVLRWRPEAGLTRLAARRRSDPGVQEIVRGLQHVV